MAENINNALDLKVALCDIDGGRFADVVHALRIIDACPRCRYFNPTVEDEYRCYAMGSCIAATLHPVLVSYFTWKLGWITESDHLKCVLGSEDV